MRRLPVAAFVALAIATIAAFFVTQHLKVTTPLLAGFPFPHPGEINPVNGQVCDGVSYRSTSVSFYLLHRSDDVDVYIVATDGTTIVRTLASGVHMQGGAHPVRRKFVWNGRLDNGLVARDGTYYIRVAFIHQARSVLISDNAGAEPVTVDTVPPHPVVTSVTPASITHGSLGPVTIAYAGTKDTRPEILIYRVSATGGARLVKMFAATSRKDSSSWNGLIGDRPAPRGTYLIGLRATDKACNTGTFPARTPVVASAYPHAELTIR